MFCFFSIFGVICAEEYMTVIAVIPSVQLIMLIWGIFRVSSMLQFTYSWDTKYYDMYFYNMPKLFSLQIFKAFEHKMLHVIIPIGSKGLGWIGWGI